mmetsp:Transcript_3062/g.11129  ORF Transcript_3062/g.11129 Transcript_3062/m.11129 type:complete len:359 (-) Transcript_3062:481-1557(-)
MTVASSIVGESGGGGGGGARAPDQDVGDAELMERRLELLRGDVDGLPDEVEDREDEGVVLVESADGGDFLDVVEDFDEEVSVDVDAGLEERLHLVDDGDGHRVAHALALDEVAEALVEALDGLDLRHVDAARRAVRVERRLGAFPDAPARELLEGVRGEAPGVVSELLDEFVGDGGGERRGGARAAQVPVPLRERVLEAGVHRAPHVEELLAPLHDGGDARGAAPARRRAAPAPGARPRARLRVPGVVPCAAPAAVVPRAAAPAPAARGVRRRHAQPAGARVRGRLARRRPHRRGPREVLEREERRLLPSARVLPAVVPARLRVVPLAPVLLPLRHRRARAVRAVHALRRGRGVHRGG